MSQELTKNKDNFLRQFKVKNEGHTWKSIKYKQDTYSITNNQMKEHFSTITALFEVN